MNESNSSIGELCKSAAAIGMILVYVVARCERWLQELPHAHRRAARVGAYRRRHQWRKADIRKLRDLGMCAPAELRLQRIERGKGRGRGVMPKYHAPDVVLRSAIAYFNALHDPATPPQKRLALLKMHTSWWPSVVEALYRHEYGACKARSEKSPSETAEQTIADRLGVSSALVHKICTAERADRRKRGTDSPDCAALSFRDFDRWQYNGGLIWPETTDAQDVWEASPRSMAAAVLLNGR